jgi:hypothetical protein
MSGKKRTPEQYRFAVEDLLDLYASVQESNGARVECETTGTQQAETGRGEGASDSSERSKRSPVTGSGQRLSTLRRSWRKKA